MSPRTSWGLAALLLAAHLALSARLLYEDSLTSDEPIHITAGFLAAKDRDLRINREHPPLAKALAGLGVLSTRDVSFPYGAECYERSDPYPLVRRFFSQPENDPLAMTARARWPLLLLSLGFALFLFCFVRALWGDRPALFVLLLYAFSPTVLGHNHLVTTDSAAMIFCFTATALSCLALERGSYGLALAAGLASGLGLLTKFSALLLLPVIALTGAVFVLYGRGDWVRTLVVCGCILAMSASTLLWGCWLFGANTPGGQVPFLHYLDGLRMVRNHVAQGHNHPQFFLGEYSYTGWWAYFPVAFVLKTSVFLQALFLIGVWQAFRKTPGEATHGRTHPRRIRRFRSAPADASSPPPRAASPLLFRCLFLFPVCYAGACVSGSLNIGFRHLMPVLPFVYLFAGVQADRHLRGGSRPATVLIPALLAGYVLSTWVSWPRTLGYFTEWARHHPERLLNDSNLDWGQDLGRLAAFMDARGIPSILLDYFGPGEAPDIYLKGRYTPWPVDRGLPESGWFAVSEFFVMTSRFHKREGRAQRDYAVLDGIQPEARIGSSIRVYRFP